MDNKPDDLKTQLEQKDKDLVQRELAVKEKEAMLRAMSELKVNSTKDVESLKQAFRDTIRDNRKMKDVLKSKQTQKDSSNRTENPVAQEQSEETKELLEFARDQKKESERKGILDYLKEKKSSFKLLLAQATEVPEFLDEVLQRGSLKDKEELDNVLTKYEEHFQKAFKRFEGANSETRKEPSDNEGIENDLSKIGDDDNSMDRLLADKLEKNTGGRIKSEIPSNPINTDPTSPPANLNSGSSGQDKSLEGLSAEDKKQSIKTSMGL